MRGHTHYPSPRIVQPGDRRRGALVGALLVLAGAVVLGWVAFDYGRQRAGYDSRRADAAIERLEQRLERMTRERNLLRSQIAVLERSSQIDRTAAGDVRGHLVELERENLELQEQLAFYRGILSAGDAEGGLRVHAFGLEPVEGERQYRYRFTVSQVVKKAGSARGRVGIYVGGIQDGEAVDLDLRDLTDGDDETLEMSFRYFQVFAGLIRLPEGFEPRRFVVNVKPTGDNHASVTQVFDWEVQPAGRRGPVKEAGGTSDEER